MKRVCVYFGSFHFIDNTNHHLRPPQKKQNHCKHCLVQHPRTKSPPMLLFSRITSATMGRATRAATAATAATRAERGAILRSGLPRGRRPLGGAAETGVRAGSSFFGGAQSFRAFSGETASPRATFPEKQTPCSGRRVLH